MLQIDFAGRKKAKHPILLGDDRKERDYDIFCTASAKSRRIYVKAIESRTKDVVLAVFIAMFDFYGSVPVN